MISEEKAIVLPDLNGARREEIYLIKGFDSLAAKEHKNVGIPHLKQNPLRNDLRREGDCSSRSEWSAQRRNLPHKRLRFVSRKRTQKCWDTSFKAKSIEK